MQAREQDALHECHARHVAKREKDAALDVLHDEVSLLKAQCHYYDWSLHVTACHRLLLRVANGDTFR